MGYMSTFCSSKVIIGPPRGSGDWCWKNEAPFSSAPADVLHDINTVLFYFIFYFVTARASKLSFTLLR